MPTKMSHPTAQSSSASPRQCKEPVPISVLMKELEQDLAAHRAMTKPIDPLKLDQLVEELNRGVLAEEDNPLKRASRQTLDHYLADSDSGKGYGEPELEQLRRLNH